jgi:poly-gamma-glutamate capsule biosynthesis protein CapA/YwtB (metallophosphatase superfamily)
MPTLRWWLGNWRTIRGPRLGKERFGGRIDERHLTRRLRGALRIVHESIRMMLASELPTCSADLIGARAKRYAEHLVWCATSRHREASSSAAVTAAETSASSADIVSRLSPPPRALSGAGAPRLM